MKIYADAPMRKTRQLVGDGIVLLWIFAWIQIAVIVNRATMALAAPGRGMVRAGDSLAGGMTTAKEKLSQVPVIGELVASPFGEASDASAYLAAAGHSQISAVSSLAFWLALAVAFIPIGIVLMGYLPARIKFSRIATASQKFIDSSADLELFALRAMANQPLPILAKVSADPVTAWRLKDPTVITALARLELADLGLKIPKQMS